nr:MFS transporter [Corynebacterium kalidii]
MGGRPVSVGGKGLVLVSVVLTQLMIVLDMTVVAVALPSMQEDLGLTAGQRPWVMTAYTLAFGGLVLFGGRLSGVLGLRGSYRLGLTGFALASLVAGVAPSFAVLVAARVAQGVFAAVLAPTVLALVNRTFTETQERSRAFAVLGATGGLGAAVGLIVGGVLTESLDWRWTMYVNIPIALVAAVVSVSSLPSGDPRTALGRLFDDVVGLAAGCGAVFSLIYGLDRAQQDGWGAWSTVVLFVVAGVLAVGFVLRERRAAAPVLPLGMLRNASRTSSYAVMFVSTCAQMGSLVYLTYYFQEHLGYSPMATGVAFLPMVAALVVTAGVAGRLLVPRYGAKVCFPGGLAVQAVALFILSRVTVETTYGEVVLPGMVVFGAGLGLAVPVVFNAGTRGVPEGRSGLASSIISMSQQVGASFGVAVLSTYATRSVEGYIEEHAGRVEAQAAEAMARENAYPGSPEATGIVDRVIDALTQEAQIDAYGGGFALVGTIVASAAVILLAAVVVRWRYLGRSDAASGGAGVEVTGPAVRRRSL